MAAGGVTSPGMDAGETARHLAACFHVLRELVHGSSRWLALEPRLDVKYALADQIHDDARSARALSRRLRELRPPLDVNHPGPALAALLDRVAMAPTPSDYLEQVYGDLKPRLAASVEQRLAETDPWQDEPTLRALIELRHRQAYHLADAPHVSGPRPVGAESLPADVAAGRPRRLRPGPRIDVPARDPYVAVVAAATRVPTGGALLARLSDPTNAPARTDGPPAPALVHALMHERLCWAEAAALTSHEHPEQPGVFHLDMAKLAWDAARHAQGLERLLSERHGGHWGKHPVSLGDFRRLYVPGLDRRLAAMRDAAAERLSRRPALWAPGAEAPAPGAEIRQSLDFLLADEEDHLECLTEWSDRIRREASPAPQSSR